MKTLQCNDIFISRPVWFVKIPEDLLEKAQLCDLVESHIQPFLVPLRRVRNHTNTAPAAPVHLYLLHMLIQAPPAPICSGEWLGCCVGHGGAGRSVNMCCSGPLRLPACLGQLGSRVCVLDPPPPGNSDWLESHLPNRLAPRHQTVERQRSLGGDRKSSYMTEGEEEEEEDEEKECCCMSDDYD